MKKHTQMKLLAIKIEWHWLLIFQLRKKINRLYKAGEPLTAEKLLSLDRRVCAHSEKILTAQYAYQELAGISSALHLPPHTQKQSV